MDFQTIANWIGGAGLGLLGWLANELWSAVKELRRDISQLREHLPQSYVTKHDFQEIKEMLVRIDTKLDRKVDKD